MVLSHVVWRSDYATAVVITYLSKRAFIDETLP